MDTFIIVYFTVQAPKPWSEEKKNLRGDGKDLENLFIAVEFEMTFQPPTVFKVIFFKLCQMFLW